MTIAVLLTVYNRKEKTIYCLENLYKSFNYLNINNDYKMNIYLTDDGSTDGTSEVINQKFPNVILLKGNGNLFWNKGMLNSWTFAAKSHHDFYIWLNDDTILQENAFKLIFGDYNTVSKNDDAIIIGTTKSITGKTTYGGRYDSELLNPNGKPQKCIKINGNFVLIPNNIFQHIGFLDDKFHHALGDHDYGLRALKKQFNLFTTSEYIGICESHDHISLCFRTNTSLIKRIKHLYSPLGNNPNTYFYYEFKHYGLITATKHYLSTLIRVLIPSLWKKM